MNLIVLPATGGSRTSVGVHEVTRGRCPKQLDDGVATGFVDPTANNAHKLILFWHKPTAWKAAPVQGRFDRRPTVHRPRELYLSTMDGAPLTDVLLVMQSRKKEALATSTCICG